MQRLIPCLDKDYNNKWVIYGFKKKIGMGSPIEPKLIL